MNKKKMILPIAMLLLLIMVTVGVTFAAFTFTKEGTVENVIESSTIMLTYTEGKTGIILNEAYPMSDETGKLLTGTNNVFDFTVQATLGKSNVISYEVTAVKIPITDMTPLEDNEVKLYLERAIDPATTYQEVLTPSNFLPIENQTEVGSPIGSMMLDSGIFMEEGTTIHNYRLKMWLDESAQIPNGEARKYGIKVNVYAKQLMMTEESCFTFDASMGTITNYSDTCPKNVIVPSTIDNVSVTTIGDRAFQNKQLESVFLPESITKIGQLAFAYNQLINLTIPNDVTLIEANAFTNNKLTNITIPDSVTSIGYGAFSSNLLTNIILPNNVNLSNAAFVDNKLPDNQAFIYNRKNGSIDYTSLNSYGGAKRNNVIIPDKVITIGQDTFNNLQLDNITIPSTVTTIHNGAFANNQLTNLIIPTSVISIANGAFNNNQLPDSQAFIYKRNNDGSIDNTTLISYGGKNKDNVIVPDNVTNIDNSAFQHVHLSAVKLPNTLINIGGFAFQDSQLTNVTIPDSVISIGSWSFRNNNFTTVTIPRNVIEIEVGAFSKANFSNLNLVKIVNQTGRSFDWQEITGSSSAATFITGTIAHSYGDIIVTSE